MSVTVQKNNKQCIVEVNRDILSHLVNLSATRGLVANCKKTMEYSLSQRPLALQQLREADRKPQKASCWGS